MTLNGVIALILLYFTKFGSSAACRLITSQWLKTDLYCLQNIVFHFGPKLTHPDGGFSAIAELPVAFLKDFRLNLDVGMWPVAVLLEKFWPSAANKTNLLWV